VEIVEAIEEELFPPKPGGMVDRHRKRMAAQKAANDQAEHEAEAIEAPSYKAVKVAPESPEIFAPMTYTIAAGASQMILPNSPYRYRATICLVTAATTVTLAKDSGAALGGVGFVLGPSMPIAVYSRGQLWAYNSTGSPVQVSVLAELYAPEQHAAPASAEARHHKRR
jgi:hypothetical protein